jgi:hypothetical protein
MIAHEGGVAGVRAFPCWGAALMSKKHCQRQRQSLALVLQSSGHQTGDINSQILDDLASTWYGADHLSQC